MELSGILELRQYKKDPMESISLLVLKLPRFSTRIYGEVESAAISKLTYIWVVLIIDPGMIVHLLLYILSILGSFCFVVHWIKELYVNWQAIKIFLNYQAFYHDLHYIAVSDWVECFSVADSPCFSHTSSSSLFQFEFKIDEWGKIYRWR